MSALFAHELDSLATPLITWRRYLHRYPEEGWTEFATVAFLAATLERWGFRLTLGADALCSASRMGLPAPELLTAAAARAQAHGVESRWLGIFHNGMTALWADIDLGSASQQAPLLVLRFDMDALPINEARDAAHFPVCEGFASLHHGLMHACGHDGHMAIGLGLARLLSKCRAAFSQPLRVRLLFQPAEEGVRGAQAVTDAGALAGATWLLGLHIGIAAQRTGELVCGVDNFLATSKIDVRFTGLAAHAGAAPQKGHNALLAASAAALGLHAISRNGNGDTRVCVGTLQAGQCRNTIPAHAAMELEVRASNDNVHQWLEAEAQRVVAAAAQLWHCSEEHRLAGRAPAASSHPLLRAVVQRCAQQVNFFTAVRPACAFGASEDFSLLVNTVHEAGGQADYVLIGSDLASGHHTPYFDFDERVLLPSVALMAHICHSLAQQQTA